MKYEYFLAYNIKNGSGNRLINSDELIDSIEDVRKIEKIIKEEENEKDLVIINWILLSTKPEN